MAQLDKYFGALVDAGGSDLHLSAGRAPAMRTHGEIAPMDGERALTDAKLREMMREIVSDSRWQIFEQTHDIDFAYRLEGIGRFRANYFVQAGGAGAVFRIVPETVIPIEKLGLPPAVSKLADLESGLVLVTGPTGSGKSTTLAAVIDRVNTKYSRHIVTIEDPVEFVHQNKRSVLSQREVGANTVSFAAALKSATRQDVDVVLVGEMRDLETIELALNAAAMGILVFGTLHTSGAAKTVDRVIDVFPAEDQAQARNMLSDSLAAVVSQVLLRRADDGGRVAAHEILLRTSALGGVIREGNTAMLASIIAGGKRMGMQTMDAALAELVQKRIVTREAATIHASPNARL
ncbi:MAG: PilT/PilU family type 4a pilus ATPase [Myxococcales bacterium]|nr:PilT/PilU family type 4a pilus ATPase [Myxococcales bacterium]